MTTRPRRRGPRPAPLALALAALWLPLAAWPQAAPAAARPAAPLAHLDGPLAQVLAEQGEANLLLLELLLDGSRLADSLNAYEVGSDLLLPLGELARLLTLGVTVDTATRSAGGFVVREDRAFRLDASSRQVRLPDGSTEALAAGTVRWIDDDLYVPLRLLQRWWPLDLDLKMASLSLTVRPREKLPIQARLERERAARALRARGAPTAEDPGYPRAPADYRLWSVPFVDQTLGVQFNREADGRSSTSAAWSAYLTATCWAWRRPCT